MTKFAIVSRDDSESIKISKDIQRYLFNNGLAYADKDPDIVCVVGGDGTFLTAIHKYINKLDQVVFAAVNTGTLGFFADYTVEELDQYRLGHLLSENALETRVGKWIDESAHNCPDLMI